MSNDPDANKELTGEFLTSAAVSSRAERIAEKLNAQFAPSLLDVADDSAKHKGHAGARPEGETHLNVTMTSAKFSGLTRLARHRLVSAALKDEFDAGLHALSMKLQAPDEGV
jgi:BolA protein